MKCHYMDYFCWKFSYLGGKTMKGLIISTDRENAENIKLIVENMRAGFEMEILDPGENNFCLIDCSEYDFMINSMKPAMAHEIISQIRPFAKTILNRTTNYIGLYRNQKIVYIDRNKIIGIEIMGRTCLIYTRKFVYKISRFTLNSLLDLLDDPNIVRCHKSYAVNIKYIKSFMRETKNRWKVDFIIETRFDCRISENFMGNVVEKFEKYNNVEAKEFMEFC